MKQLLKAILTRAARKAYENGRLKTDVMPDMEIDVPRHETHGDLSTNLAMVWASGQKMAPRKIAEAVVEHIDQPSLIEKIDIAGPGFINFYLTSRAWLPVVETIMEKDRGYGSVDIGGGSKVQVEFVSANPTGPLHVGHGRGAAVGDAVGNILSFAGYHVEKEYYINDSGRQIHTLGRSVWLRLMQLKGKDVDFPEECYQGAYIRTLAEEFAGRHGADVHRFDESQGIAACARFAADSILDGIREDLNAFGVVFDHWFSEQSLYDNEKVEAVIDLLRDRSMVYEKDGALWFGSERFGDEKDRVVVRSNGQTTYFASDIAYHKDKFERGFDRVIDVWGADHHGYINRINACIDACGDDSNRFDVILVQLVTLLRDKQPVAMSTRAGEFVTLKDIVEEVGKDAARFLFLSRGYDSHLDFDLDVAKQQNSENPVYYVQYVHARISSILSKAVDEGLIKGTDIVLDEHLTACLERCCENEEVRLLKALAAFPEEVEKSARTLHPHVIFTYLMSLASLFHNYYNRHKVITGDEELSLGRLCLVASVKKVIRNGLSLLGVSAPERM